MTDKSSENHASPKHRKGEKGYLRAAFSAAIIGAAAVTSACNFDFMTHSAPAPAPVPDPVPAPVPDPVPAPPADSQPDLVQAFGKVATRDYTVSSNPYGPWWEAMLQRQKSIMENPAWVEAFQRFLATFDRFRGEPVAQMANDVNLAELRDVAYNDTVNCVTPNTDSAHCAYNNYFWPSPAETANHGQGNCIDQATLQYFIMRYLGVPEEDLFIAAVNASGQDTGANHAVLLVDITPGEDQDFLVMNDGGPVVDSTRYVDSPGAPFTPVMDAGGGWLLPYVFSFAFNETGLWKVNPPVQQNVSKPTLPAVSSIPRFS